MAFPVQRACHCDCPASYLIASASEQTTVQKVRQIVPGDRGGALNLAFFRARFCLVCPELRLVPFHHYYPPTSFLSYRTRHDDVGLLVSLALRLRLVRLAPRRIPRAPYNRSVRDVYRDFTFYDVCRHVVGDRVVWCGPQVLPDSGI
jgi:hypothetical protein